MRRLIFGLLWGSLGLLVAACSSATSAPIETTALPTSAAGTTATPVRAPRNVHTPTEFNLLYYPTDINIVGKTGRPQFINAYADW